MRYLSGRGISLTHTFYDDETALTVPSATVTVRDDSGTAVVTNQAATASGTTWTATLSALPVGKYTASWTGGSYTDADAFEVVGGFLFTLKEARDSDEDLDAVRFPTAKLRAARDIVEAEFEQITSRSFTQRSRVVKVLGDDTDSALTGLYDVQGVTSVTESTSVLDATSDIFDETLWQVTSTGLLISPEEIPVGCQLLIKVTYGFTSVPDDIKRAGLTRLRHYLVAERSAIPERATGFNSADGGYFQLATAGRNGYETGLPDVDATLKRYRYDVLNSASAGA